MSNWIKKVVQKRNKQKKAEKKEHKKSQIIGNLLCASIILSYLLIFAWCSVDNSSADLGYVLSIFSLFLTACFEIYEWIMLLLNQHKFVSSRNKEIYNFYKDVSLFPAAPSIVFTIIYFLIVIPNKLANYNCSNLICSITIFINIFSMLLRKTYSINKEI